MRGMSLSGLRVLDWCYIDADHTENSVLEDFRNLRPLLAAGAYVIFDDYGIEGWWRDSVTKAVERLLRENEIDKVEVVGSQFISRLAEAG